MERKPPSSYCRSAASHVRSSMLARCFALRESLLRLELPFDCCLCGEPEPQGGLCASCNSLLQPNTPACRQCALPLAQGVKAVDRLENTRQQNNNTFYCAECLLRPPEYRRAIVPFVYSFPADFMISRFKYHGDMPLGRVLGNLLAVSITDNLLQASDPPEMVVPVPLAPGRLRDRGFNQALELARTISTCCDLPLCQDLLRRDSPLPQSGLRFQQRRSRATRLASNSSGYHCSYPVSGKILLVDDVMTTGVTVAAVAGLLLRSGAEQVDVAAVARAEGANA